MLNQKDFWEEMQMTQDALEKKKKNGQKVSVSRYEQESAWRMKKEALPD